ncbi:hypothetical protein [Sphingobacterium sp.]|uniref:hypothetical protein n=1 Tax=Sphingobacterium sp. TaxID=341027 RepID=UPI00289FD9C7|nr:hypothetical protein [Sphingobacterium sp.]
MKDRYEKWAINIDLPQDLFFYKMFVEYSEIIILLKNLVDHVQILEIKFEYFVSYKVTIDLALMKMVNENDDFRGFARSTCSGYLDSVVEGSYDILKRKNIEHFVICNLENVIEVLSDEPATFRLLNTDEMQW